MNQTAEMGIVIEIENAMEEDEEVNYPAKNSVPTIDILMRCAKSKCNRVQAFQR